MRAAPTLEERIAAGAPRPRHVVGTAVVLFALRVALGWHGFSLPEWHKAIDGSRAREIVFGEGRAIRGDDWAVILPMVLSQRVHQPAFPAVNRLLGDGQSMIASYSMPVLHPVTLFRPQVWGYFVGADVGLAWHWGMLVTGLFLAWFWLFLVIAPDRTLLAGLGAGLLLVTPFVQFWSLNSAPALAFTALWCRAAIGFVPAGRALPALGWALLGTWSALGLFFYLYPPYAIPLAVLGVTIVVGWLGRVRVRVPRPALKVAIAAALTAVSLAVVAGWWTDARDALRLSLATEYPGRRYVTGGGSDLTTLLRHDLLLPLWFTSWDALGNICEAASAAFLFPLVALAVPAASIQRRTRPDALGVALLGFVAMAVFWMVGPPHPALAAWTPLHLVPTNRMLGALVPADVALAVWFVAAGPAVRPRRAVGWLVLAAWAALLAWVGWQLHRTLPGARLRWLVPAGAAVVLAGHLLLRQRWQGLAWLATLCAAGTLGFNPIVRGGSRYLHDNVLARRILAIDQSWGGSTSWLVWNDGTIANLPRLLGVHSWNGVQVYPQARLWQALDPAGERHAIWNRYANVAFTLTTDPGTISIASPQADAVIVTIAPANPAVRALGVTHAIVDARVDPSSAAVAGVRPIGRVGRHWLYQLADGPP